VARDLLATRSGFPGSCDRARFYTVKLN
jgi:hypothetical protein